MPPPGFEYDNKTILFIDVLGRDISFERWRADLYYRPHLAKTALSKDELSYEVFLAAHQPRCYPTYREFQIREGN